MYCSTFHWELTLPNWCFNYIRNVHNIFWYFTLWFAGIGVDDMFVVVGSYQSLSHHELSLPLTQRMGKLLRHAGVSILVTSVTDILAFGIGATTVSVDFQVSIRLFKLKILWTDTKSIIMYYCIHGNICPRFICHCCHWAYLRLDEIQCLKLSFFKCTCVWVNSR